MIAIPFSCSDSVKFRLSYYEKCRIREKFKWVNKKLRQEMICPLPVDDLNPNNYRIPKRYGGSFTHVYSEKHIEGVNWGNLHSQVERLYQEGWRIESL